MTLQERIMHLRSAKALHRWLCPAQGWSNATTKQRIAALQIARWIAKERFP